jgi:hypothetical protein
MAKPGKEWAWSYSKLKNFETCAKRHYEVDLAKNYVEEQEEGGALDWGNRVHKALAKACQGKEPLGPDMASYQPWVDKIKAGPGRLLVEQKYAITRDFGPTSYFADNVWYRGIADIVRIDGPVALVVDWKTGKVVPDSVQLMLMAQCLFAHFPNLLRVRSEFVWLKDDCSTKQVLDRQEVADQWVDLIDRVHSMENAAKNANYPPMPGRLCRSWCPVTSCPFHGKGAR